MALSVGPSPCKALQGARARGAGGARQNTGHGQPDGAPMCNAMFNDESGPVNDGQVNRHEPRSGTWWFGNIISLNIQMNGQIYILCRFVTKLSKWRFTFLLK